MTVRSIFNPNVATIDADADIEKAAVLMRQEHVGDLIVTRQRNGRQEPVGVITDRDIVVEVVARGASPGDIRVGDVLTRELISLKADSGIEFALKRMRDAGIRRAPVVDTDGQLIGVMSLDDAIDHLATQLSEIAGAIRWQQTVEARKFP
jgi:CBS domain-containing protein